MVHYTPRLIDPGFPDGHALLCTLMRGVLRAIQVHPTSCTQDFDLHNSNVPGHYATHVTPAVSAPHATARCTMCCAPALPANASLRRHRSPLDTSFAVVIGISTHFKTRAARAPPQSMLSPAQRPSAPRLAESAAVRLRFVWCVHALCLTVYHTGLNGHKHGKLR